MKQWIKGIKEIRKAINNRTAKKDTSKSMPSQKTAKQAIEGIV